MSFKLTELYKGAAGIYRIRLPRRGNLPLVYVGRAEDLWDRHKEHLSALRAGTHHNGVLQAAYNASGLEPVFEVLELTTVASVRGGRLVAELPPEGERADAETAHIVEHWATHDEDCANVTDGANGGAMPGRYGGGWRKRSLPKGVYRDSAAPASRPFKAMIRLQDGRNRHLGYHATVEEAAAAYDLAVDELLGGKAYKNAIGRAERRPM